MESVITENGVGAITGPLLQDVLREIIDTSEYLVQTSSGSADGRALAAEGWAVGTQRGVPVQEGSPYYENNSLYWATVVGNIAHDLGDVVREAQAATGSAEAAATRASGAADDAVAAAGQATSAAGDAASAAGDATAAAGTANIAAENADTKAAYAKEQGDYAKGEIDGAKGDYPTLNARFNHVDEISMYFEEVGPSADPDLIDEYDRVLRLAYQCISDMQGATSVAESAAGDANSAAQAARANADYAESVARQANQVAQRAAANADLAGQAALDATSAASEAGQRAHQAEVAAGEATAAAGDATSAASAATGAAGTANTAAGNADTKAAYAKEQGDYAKGEIDGARGDYPTLNARFNHVDEISMYFEEVGPSADPGLVDEYDRVLRVAYQMISDMQEATDNADAKAALAAAAAALADARSAECVEKTALANNAAAYATAQGNYARQKADEIEDAKGAYRTLGDRLDAMQEQLEAAMYFQVENN